ncbi:MAG: hypothetical protein AUJ92_13475 [Armatimonadetes bacterium CG2_30_59_28]|nr:hypothetical protein [Armatimonadota bacterium]OIO92771.1 MAG: hypothetical protein AUJ92_13475 [Armatimonadetes bacterium CG2_30_59_28]PIU65095.1 MAG: hypothetical protein COS85_10100 [Armatimonadetes bacterium CG07_land_8_20_14_0_80_59_28]PIX38846.1 MAG: hypothetical protein COZ56_19380 [Armatimonadetes bacterium CG_4_8_14_3_um_filter_58_9]PJB61861.1 MAG: hypothetical protein CO095_19845 [Armatimonadetes bacterium CG_4_9_14_3_um_filter_58_7]
MKRIIVSGTLLLFAWTTAPALSAIAAEPQPSILFITFDALWNDSPDEKHTQHLADMGFQVNLEEAKKVHWERVGRYNVLALYNLPLHEEGGRWPKDYDALRSLLQRFVDSGGGLFNAGLCATHGQTMVHNELLKEFEMSAPFERIVETDAAKIYAMPKMFRHRFALTKEVAGDHPVARNVASLWYYFPGDGATLGEFPHPLNPLSDEWKVVVWGSPTARSVRMPNFGEVTNETTEPPATYKSRPSIMAVRAMGKGRVAVTVMNQSHLINNGWHFAYEGVALAKGDDKTPSDWEKLFINTYRWLAKPSLAAGAPGGFVAKQEPDEKAAAHIIFLEGDEKRLQLDIEDGRRRVGVTVTVY